MNNLARVRNERRFVPTKHKTQNAKRKTQNTKHKTQNTETLKIDVESRQVWNGEQELQLTRLEYEVLLYLARRAGKVVTFQELWREVWNNQVEPGKTERAVVRQAIKRVRGKLGRDYHTSPYPLNFWETHTRNAYLFPDGQFTQLWQTVSVTQNYHYRFSVWLYTYIATATVRYYNYTTQTYTDCGSTTSTEMVLLSCEFKAAETGQISFIVQSSAVSPGVVVTDDWALTRIVKPPRWAPFPLWSSLPVKYYVESGYVTRTNLVADRWITQVGQAVFQRTSDPSQAKIKFTSGYRGYFYPDGTSMYIAQTWIPDGNGVVRIDVNRDFMEVYLNYRYGNEARESVIGHEFGHALGLNHTDRNCNMLTTTAKEGAWLCSVSSPTWGDVQKVRKLY